MSLPFGLLLTEFLPHGYCLHWRADLLWLHIISDALIVIAYFSIPLLMFSMVQRRKDLPFRWFFVVFASFILACGSTHLLGIVTLWRPWYRLEGWLKAFTALTSIVTAGCFRFLLPYLLKIPSQQDLKYANEALEKANRELALQSLRLEESNASLQTSLEKMRSSELAFRQLADSMPQMVWESDGDGAITYQNERWFEFTGFDRTLNANQSWALITHAEDLRACREAWFEGLRTKRAMEMQARFWDRSIQDYRWYLGRGVPILSKDGRVDKWVGTLTDIDENKRVQSEMRALNSELESRVQERTEELSKANQELTRTQVWLESLLESEHQVAIIAVGNDGLIGSFNRSAERLLGYRAEELIGKHTPGILYPKSLLNARTKALSNRLKRPVEVDELFSAENQPTVSFVQESQFIHRDGTLIDVSLALGPMIDGNCSRIGTLGIAADIRHQKSLQRQLDQNYVELLAQTRRAEEASRAKSSFLAAMSHEIRTPMNGVVGMTGLLLATSLTSEQRVMAEVIRTSGDALLSIINDILDFSKIEAGKLELEETEFDLHTMVEETFEVVSHAAESKGLALSFSVAEDVPLDVVGDSGRLRQILLNLVANAVKFTEQGSVHAEVSLDANRGGRTLVRFEVRDTGIGLTRGQQASLFQAFTQADRSVTRRFGGTGLGLSIAKRLVEFMGGSIGATGEPQKGSTFWFDVWLGLQAGKDRYRDIAGKQILMMSVPPPVNASQMEYIRRCGAQVVVDPCPLAQGESGRTADLLLLDSTQHEVLHQAKRTFGNKDGKSSSLPVLICGSTQDVQAEDLLNGLWIAGYVNRPLRRVPLLSALQRILSGEGVAQQDAEEPVLDITQTQKPRILVAEDNLVNQMVIRGVLEMLGCNVDIVENGKEACDAVQAFGYNLLLMDRQMPVMDGFSATRQIRAHETERRVPIIALSASVLKEDREQCFEAGMDDFLPKPVSTEDLAKVLRQWLPAWPFRANAVVSKKR